MIDRRLRRVSGSPLGFPVAVAVITAAGLGLDHFADRRFQNLLGLGAAAVLVLALRSFTPQERAQTVCLVLVGGCLEVVGSIIWGLYRYRLGNLPLFVPPGHGLVYLTGLRLSQSGPARRHPRA